MKITKKRNSGGDDFVMFADLFGILLVTVLASFINVSSPSQDSMDIISDNGNGFGDKSATVYPMKDGKYIVKHHDSKDFKTYASLNKTLGALKAKYEGEITLSFSDKMTAGYIKEQSDLFKREHLTPKMGIYTNPK